MLLASLMEIHAISYQPPVSWIESRRRGGALTICSNSRMCCSMRASPGLTSWSICRIISISGPFSFRKYGSTFTTCVSPVTWSLNQLCSLACCAAFLCKHLRTDRNQISLRLWGSGHSYNITDFIHQNRHSLPPFPGNFGHQTDEKSFMMLRY
jgi:hypothetical protein